MSKEIYYNQLGDKEKLNSRVSIPIPIPIAVETVIATGVSYYFQEIKVK